MLHQQESLKNRILDLSKTRRNDAQALQSKEKKFAEQIYKVGFSDLEAYKQAFLSHEERENFQELKNSLEKKKSELLAEQESG